MTKLYIRKLLAFCFGALLPAVGWAQIGPPNTNAATNNAYNFTQSVSGGAYVTLTGGTVFQTGAAVSTDAVTAAITLPFTFPFNGRTYTTVFLYNNGFITLGSTPHAVSMAAPLSSNAVFVEGAIAPLAQTLTAAAATGSLPEIRYGSQSGKWVAQWQDVRTSTLEASATSQRIRAQLRLSPTGVIEFVYGSGNISTATGRNAQVGIRGTEDSETSNRLLGTVNNKWTNSFVGTSSASTITLGNVATDFPPTDLLYTFTPGTATIPAATYASLPYSENFDGTWQTLATVPEVVPNNTNWRAFPLRGDNSWRRSDNAVSGFTSVTGWGNILGPVTIATPAAGTAARFHSYNTGLSTTLPRRIEGNLDLYINCSTPGSKSLAFDYVNTGGTDSLNVQLSTDGGANFVSIASYGVIAAFATQNVSFTSNSANTIIRLSGRGDNGTNDIGVDNILVKVLICDGPPAGISLTSSTINTANFSWTNNASATNGYVYSARRVSDNTVISPGTLGAGATSVSISTPAVPGEAYFFRIYSKCNSGASSSDADSIFFRGGQAPLNYAISRGSNNLVRIKDDPATQYFTWLNGATTTQNVTTTLDFTNPDARLNGTTEGEVKGRASKVCEI